jgi:hypothetical protein
MEFGGMPVRPEDSRWRSLRRIERSYCRIAAVFGCFTALDKLAFPGFRKGQYLDAGNAIAEKCRL